MQQLEDILKTKQPMPLSRKTVLNVFHLNSIIKDKLLLSLKPYDLSIEQFNVLRILRGQKGQPVNLQDIQDRMINKMSNTTRLVDKLIIKGYVERFVCENNRRKVEIFITETGLKLLKNLDPVVDETEKSITAALNAEELKILNTLINKLK
ncbi:MarR family transcriptional regulator [Paucihalobacter ruber]|uniref:MarR family transcriptional regulator n=1 Tax=Paucihalobacter ruber TaxID=2567861 RepID=A0A506PNI3_9FLAO|nr:MarR family transcriptional regulator [Paucihalobacter ruber]TPV35443.1 MarR family transcriptional regulator [Paucihalobacter ruber]